MTVLIKECEDWNAAVPRAARDAAFHTPLKVKLQLQCLVRDVCKCSVTGE